MFLYIIIQLPIIEWLILTKYRNLLFCVFLRPLINDYRRFSLDNIANISLISHILHA